jgi:hypothetical protein
MHFKFYLSLLIGSVVLGISCGGPSERIKETAAKSPTPAPTQSERLISGVFAVSGAGDNGVDPYTGILTIAPQGDVYSFRWSTNRGSRSGVGVQIGNSAAASFAPTGGGKGCGVVLYKIASDGSLDGKIANWGEDKFIVQRAIRVEGSGFVGKYRLDGAGGGSLSIVRDGGGYDFEWISDDSVGGGKLEKRRVAFGIWKGNVAAASFGGRHCSFALYDVQSNGNLEGDWGGQKALTFGTEMAKRQ